MSYSYQTVVCYIVQLILDLNAFKNEKIEVYFTYFKIYFTVQHGYHGNQTSFYFVAFFSPILT